MKKIVSKNKKITERQKEKQKRPGTYLFVSVPVLESPFLISKYFRQIIIDI